jgi:Uncharacterized protein conserved in bacteria
MDIVRDKEFVQQFHYDARNFAYEKENGVPEQVVHIQIQIIEGVPDVDEANTVLTASVTFAIILDKFIVSGFVAQNNVVENRKLKEQTDLSQAEMEEIAEPLLDMISRLTREVSEVALDEPGVNLQF